MLRFANCPARAGNICKTETVNIRMGIAMNAKEAMLTVEQIEEWRTTLRTVFDAKHDVETDALCDMALERARAAQEPTEPTRSGPNTNVICHAPGEKCLGCDHYYGKAAVCKYAAQEPDGWVIIASHRVPRLIELVSAACRKAATDCDERAYELWTAVRKELLPAPPELPAVTLGGDSAGVGSAHGARPPERTAD